MVITYFWSLLYLFIIFISISSDRLTKLINWFSSISASKFIKGRNVFNANITPSCMCCCIQILSSFSSSWISAPLGLLTLYYVVYVWHGTCLKVIVSIYEVRKFLFVCPLFVSLFQILLYHFYNLHYYQKPKNIRGTFKYKQEFVCCELISRST